jgi:hypothetical protein
MSGVAEAVVFVEARDGGDLHRVQHDVAAQRDPPGVERGPALPIVVAAERPDVQGTILGEVLAEHIEGLLGGQPRGLQRGELGSIVGLLVARTGHRAELATVRSGSDGLAVGRVLVEAAAVRVEQPVHVYVGGSEAEHSAGGPVLALAYELLEPARDRLVDQLPP